MPYDNWQMTNNDFNLTANKKPLINEVDALADQLVHLYANPKFRPWYCRIVNDLGVARVHEIIKRAEGVNNSGKLFSKMASEERKQLLAKQKLQAMKDEISFGR